METLRARAKWKKTEQVLIALWLLSFFLDSYCFFSFSKPYFPVTLFSVVTGCAVVINGLRMLSRRRLVCTVSGVICLLMCCYLVLNHLVSTMGSFTGCLWRGLCFAAFLLSTRTETEEEFKGHVRVLMTGLDLMAFYGIYQFIGTNFIPLPFTDLWWEGHSVLHYNWKGIYYFAGGMINRSNAIFLEPSFFSQFLGISIVLRITRMLEKSGQKYDIPLLLVNLLAFACTLSGTGVIILVGSLAIYLIQARKTQHFSQRFVKYCVLIFAAVFVFSLTPVGEDLVAMFLRRVGEISRKGSSGYARFVAGIDVIADLWKENPLCILIGAGSGSDQTYLRSNAMSMTYYGAETVIFNGLLVSIFDFGIVGAALWISLLLSLWKRKRRPLEMTVLMCAVIPALICCDTMVVNYYWIIMYLLNVKIREPEVREAAIPPPKEIELGCGSGNGQHKASYSLYRGV